MKSKILAVIFTLVILFTGISSAFASGDTTAPSVPSQLIATAVSSSQVSLSWMSSTDDTGVAGYDIYQNGIQVATTTNTSYYVTSLAPTTSYSFTVAAYDAAGNTSAQSSSASATTTAPLPPTTPVLTVSPLSPTQMTLTWTASTDTAGVIGYRIYQNGSQIATSANLLYIVSGLLTSTTYNFSVAAYDSAGVLGAQSTPVIAVTSGGGTATAIPPSVPTGLAAVSTSSSQINLTWTSSTDTVAVTGYNVYINAVLAGTSPTTYYSATGLTPATSYSFTVAAYDAAGNTSAQSTAVSALTASIGNLSPSVVTPTPDTTAVATPAATPDASATVIAGCTGTTGFSTATGQSCAGNTVAAPHAFTFTKSIKKGSSGNEVMELQTFLNAHGYKVGTPDGSFGSKTKAALVSFQIAHKLSGDGITGPLTRKALNQ